ncbi:MAG: signal peptidase I [Clostridia bacterium]|nr:signal peptidase I [Clostridia bacterium]
MSNQEPENQQPTLKQKIRAFLDKPVPVKENKKKKQKPGKEPEKVRTMQDEIISWVVTILAAVVIALVIRTFLFEMYGVDGASMSNTLINGEKMFCTKYDYLLGSPSRNDIVICHYPGRGSTNFVKRLVALPGDTVEIRHRKLYVNGELVEDPEFMGSEPNNDYALRTLGEDEYFVIGDNRGHSNDSRAIGPISRSQIIAHVRTVLYPFSNIRNVE